MDYERIKSVFTSRESKLKALKLLMAKLGRQPSPAEGAGLMSIMTRADMRFFREHDDIESARRALVDVIGTDIMARIAQANTEEAEFNPSDDELRDHMMAEINMTTENSDVKTKKQQYDLIDTSAQPQPQISPAPTPSSRGRGNENAGVVSGLLGWTNVFDMLYAINPLSLARSSPILTLDTRNRNLVDPDPSNRSKMVWNFTQGLSITQGSVNGIGVIRDIISIDCANIYLPLYNSSLYTEYRQISMYIEELSNQASILSARTRYHFLFDATIVPDDTGSTRLKLVPAFDDSEVIFDKPVTSLNTLTVSFASPAETISFGYDRDTNPTSVSVANPAVFTTSHTHNLTAGDLVYLEGFTTSNVSGNNTLITLANRESGHVISNVTTNTFEISALDTSTVTSPSVRAIIYGSRRFFIPLKIKYIGGKQFS